MNAAYLGHQPTHPKLINDLLSTTPEIISLDFETVSLKDTTLVGLGVAINPQEAMYFPLLPEPSPYLADLLRWLYDNRIVKVWQNALFDLDAVYNDSLFSDLIEQPTLDTMVMAQLAGYPSKLTDLAPLCNSEAQDMKTVLGKRKTTLELPEDILARKCCMDVRATFAAYEHLKSRIDMDYVKNEMKLIPIILHMQHRGLKIDHQVRAELRATPAKQMKEYKELCRVEGFNPGSPKQVGYMLSKLGHSQVIGKDKKTRLARYRTDKKILSRINHPFAQWTLKYREAQKEISTYIDPLDGLDRGYTHFSFNTATRRLASRNMNLQNVPDYLRRMYEGPFSGFDYSQQELRVLAYVSQDKVMLGIFERDEDIHAATAAFMFGVPLDQVVKDARKQGKTANFAVTYGSEDRALKPLKQRWFKAFPEAAAWIHDIQKFAREYMKVPTVGGAWLYITLEEGEDEAAIDRKAVDYVCQGSAAEITKAAMIRCYEHNKKLPMVLQIHDEVLFGGDMLDCLMKIDLSHVSPIYTPVEYKIMEYWS